MIPRVRGKPDHVSSQGKEAVFVTHDIYHLLDLEQKIPSFLNCDNYGSLTATNPDPLLDDTPTNDNELH